VQTDSNTHSSSFRSVSVNAVLGDLREGLEQNIGLVLAKAVLGLIGTGTIAPWCVTPCCLGPATGMAGGSG